MSSEQVNFLLACIKHNSAGAKIDFEAVASELNIPTKAAAAKRYERLKKKAQASDFSDQAASAADAADGETGGPVGTPKQPRTPKTPRTPRTPRVKKTKVEEEPTASTPGDVLKRKRVEEDVADVTGAPAMIFTPINGPAAGTGPYMDLEDSSVKRVKSESDPDGTVVGDQITKEAWLDMMLAGKVDSNEDGV